jgi:hypothetical protein
VTVASHGNTNFCFASGGYPIRHDVAPRRGIHPPPFLTKYWLGMQQTHDLERTRDRAGATIEAEVHPRAALKRRTGGAEFPE